MARRTGVRKCQEWGAKDTSVKGLSREGPRCRRRMAGPRTDRWRASRRGIRCRRSAVRPQNQAPHCRPDRSQLNNADSCALGVGILGLVAKDANVGTLFLASYVAARMASNSGLAAAKCAIADTPPAGCGLLLTRKLSPQHERGLQGG